MSRNSRGGARSAVVAAAAGVLVVVLLSGCGDDSGSSSSGSAAEAPAASAPPTSPSATPAPTAGDAAILSESEWDAGWIYGPDTEASNYYCKPLGIDDELRALLTRPRLKVATQGSDVCSWEDKSDLDEHGFAPGHITLSVTNRDDASQTNVAGYSRGGTVINPDLHVGNGSALITFASEDDVQVLAESDSVFIMVTYLTHHDPDLGAGGTTAHQEQLTKIAQKVLSEPDKLSAFVDPLQ